MIQIQNFNFELIYGIDRPFLIPKPQVKKNDCDDKIYFTKNDRKTSFFNQLLQ